MNESLIPMVADSWNAGHMRIINKAREISSSITLGILSEDMEKSTAELQFSIDSAYNIIDHNSNQDYYKIPSDELPKLKEITDDYFNFIQILKDSLIY